MSICKPITGVSQPETILKNKQTNKQKQYQLSQMSTHVVKAHGYFSRYTNYGASNKQVWTQNRRPTKTTCDRNVPVGSCDRTYHR